MAPGESSRQEEVGSYYEELYSALKRPLAIPMSYSRYHTLETCPKKYDFAYRQKAKEVPSEAMILGTAVHSALETWVAADGEDLDDLLDIFEAACLVCRKEGDISSEEEELARVMLIDYYEILSKLDRDLVVGVEAEFELLLGGARIRGVIDRAH